MLKISGYKIFFVLIVLMFIDQISKYIIRHSGGFYICNPDIAFGIVIPAAWFWFLWGIIVAGIIWALGLFLRNKKPAYRTGRQETSNKQIINSKSETSNLIHALALSLILAGALSNMIDRIAWGCVVDFINVKIWPVFNLADSFIVLGAVLWLAKSGKKW
jgi:lipoprotein signal peptidase